MAFHGYTRGDLEFGRNEANLNRSRINGDATAKELAEIAASSFTGYIGVKTEESRDIVCQVRNQALAQTEAALELGLSEDLRDYSAVAARASQQIVLMTLVRRDGPFPQITEEEKATYSKLSEQRNA